MIKDYKKFLISLFLGLILIASPGMITSARASHGLPRRVAAAVNSQYQGNSIQVVITPTPLSTDTPQPGATSLPEETIIPPATLTPLGVTPTVTPPPSPTTLATIDPNLPQVKGMVVAGKKVTVALLSAGNLVTLAEADASGFFSLFAATGTYTIVASAPGYLKAQGTITLGTGVLTAPSIELVPGDLDDNGLIDQYDLLSVGINYNSSVPAAADLNNDGVINVLDLQIIAKHYPLSGPAVWNFIQ
jgi:hypothetical protein